VYVSWERRLDPDGRVYYVDHNTRTTTWQRPNVDLINNLHQFHQMRQNRQMDQLANRFLYPQQQAAATNDPLGPLPEGWGMCHCVNFTGHTDTHLFITPRMLCS